MSLTLQRRDRLGLALCLGLAAFDAWQFAADPSPWWPETGPVEKSDEASPPNPAEMPENVSGEQDDLGDISGRPLFIPGRRPPAVPVAEPLPPVQPPAPMPAMTLIGTMTAGAARLALLRPVGGDKTLALSEGQALDGWLLVAVQPGRVLFRQGDTAQELVLPRGQGVTVVGGPAEEKGGE